MDEWKLERKRKLEVITYLRYKEEARYFDMSRLGE